MIFGMSYAVVGPTKAGRLRAIVVTSTDPSVLLSGFPAIKRPISLGSKRRPTFQVLEDWNPHDAGVCARHQALPAGLSAWSPICYLWRSGHPHLRELENDMILKQIDPRLQELLALPAPDQIGMVVRSVEKSIEAYSRLFGWGPFEVFQHKYTELIYRGKPGNFKYRVALGQISPTLQLEFIENTEGESIYTEFLRARGEGVHHLGFTMQGIDRRIEAMKELGIGVLQSGKRPGRNFAYMDTELLVGTIIEFRERTS